MLRDGQVETVESMAAGGTVDAKARLAEYYAEQGQWEKLSSLWANRHTPPLVVLLRLIIEPGEMPLEGAVKMWQVRMLAHEEEAFQHVIDVLHEQDRADHAIDVLRDAAGTPPAWRQRLDWAEWHLLVRMLLRAERVVEALAMADDDTTRSWLAPVLAEQGRVDTLRTLMRPGDTGLALHLARTLADHGRLEEAAAIMMQRIDADEEYAYEWTIKLFVELGEKERALKVRRHRGHKLRSPIDKSDFELAQLLDQQGRHEEAIDILPRDGRAPRQLAELLAGIGRMEEAMGVLDAAQNDIRWKYVTDELAEHQAAILVRYDRVRELRDRAANGRPAHREIMRSHVHTRPGAGIEAQYDRCSGERPSSATKSLKRSRRVGNGMPEITHFDTDTAPESVVRLFWRQGVAATRLLDPVAATGLNRLSPYAMVGGNQELYRAARAPSSAPRAPGGARPALRRKPSPAAFRVGESAFEVMQVLGETGPDPAGHQRRRQAKKTARAAAHPDADQDAVRVGLEGVGDVHGGGRGDHVQQSWRLVCGHAQHVVDAPAEKVRRTGHLGAHSEPAAVRLPGQLRLPNTLSPLAVMTPVHSGTTRRTVTSIVTGPGSQPTSPCVRHRSER
ncbi:tetratricopeptide repeat protein [Streptomyces sp. SLBN-31]|uniref:tetratricopeptide repeat protein n=1 Tax=Streptomyces sp. SLBN-31 TaxID=2768444 RepID=UPI001358F149|nr:tetratricopeptide repeat protein [Streptomyces sp. SLBN-31]